MDLFALSERMMGMDGRAWARHANPWSVWTRVAILPLFTLAVFSRAWIGWWALAPLTAVALFAFVNPRLFPPPESLDNWASKGTLGERVFLSRRHEPIPGHHRRAAAILTAVSIIGAMILTYGLVALKAWPTLFGLVMASGGKLWFVDRMVWLYDDWLRADPGRAIGDVPRRREDPSRGAPRGRL
ncbi:DUF6653 family protein [Aurantimonas sp. VKM B-3413]|uniref:DUF6653 family protein n=1 Tax=Aurantimonas sp. VKM B-3413 TaxID=2779401 RepID=UPI001E4779F8|nr:DUF6653 family protein [Aurantimonas sp. VKM B-3413]MCB8838419.1 hypothetical protein [Aurantimonas sp. VKM B-3413]